MGRSAERNPQTSRTTSYAAIVGRLSRPIPRRSAAWHRAIRWIAAIWQASSTTQRASRAAIVPMLTLSWLWASVERENDVAGGGDLGAPRARAGGGGVL